VVRIDEGKNAGGQNQLPAMPRLRSHTASARPGAAQWKETGFAEVDDLISGSLHHVSLVDCRDFIAYRSRSIKETTSVTTQTSQSLTAGVGDVVLRAENRENLPNVFGASDIWGRTRSTGFTTIQYGGMDATGKVVLIRSGVTTQSDASGRLYGRASELQNCLQH
jgi:hypothetical protein